MTDDVSTAYICIYCPFNSDNLEALEHHLTSAHGHGCQDTSQALSPPSSSSILHKGGKREAPDDEQSQSESIDINSTTEHVSGAKRIKRTSSSAVLADDHSSDSDEQEDDDEDEPDSSSKLTLVCPACGSTFHRFGHLMRHAKRKHHMDLSTYDESGALELQPVETNPIDSSDNEVNRDTTKETQTIKTEDVDPLESALASQSEANPSSVSETGPTTDCPYCDFKTTDIEQFKFHIIAHIRDKNYRCLLCNRLYKYRGDCSFHIRRKHHRFSANSNDYIQRFLFESADGDESASALPGANGSSVNGSSTSINASREPDEPVRYFGCPYCDYTSNYGGDVRKHQARKHPNFESKVVKIIRQDCERPVTTSVLSNDQQKSSLASKQEDSEDDDDGGGDVKHDVAKANTNLIQQRDSIGKMKTGKKSEVNLIQHHPSTLPLISNFAPVRVFQCSSCHQQGTYKWVVERHIRAKHPDQPDAHVIELPAELAVKLQKITPPLKRFRCSLCPLQSKHTWVIIRHIKHFHTLQTASVLDIQPDGAPIHDGSFTFHNGDFASKSYNQDSETSSVSSLCLDTGMDGSHGSQRPDDDDDVHSHSENPGQNHANGSTVFVYKCSLCDVTSNIPWTIQKHIHDLHGEESNARMLTQQAFASPDGNQKATAKTSKHKDAAHRNTTMLPKMPIAAPLSPASALARAKFSPAVEEALLSLQVSKLKHAGLYAVQPKFGIKRLKCLHCFYRSNWKTDMIRHVRIRHNLTEPDHNKDMIMMTEQEARSTIETYENTFGKELRRRTFRTWNDWAKAEEEFTPKDGSLQYSNIKSEPSANDLMNQRLRINPKAVGYMSASSTSEGRKRSSTISTNNQSTIMTPNFNALPPSTAWSKFDLKQLSNPSNIVSRLLSTASPAHSNDGDDTPLDLSIKPSSNGKDEQSAVFSCEFTGTSDAYVNEEKQNFDDDPSEASPEPSAIHYRCSACPYERSRRSAVQSHVNLHIMGQGILCPLCSYTTSSLQSMTQHVAISHAASQTITKFQPAIPIATAHIVEEDSKAFDLDCRLEHGAERVDMDSSSGDGDGIDHDEIQSPIETKEDIFQCPLCTPTSQAASASNLEQFTVHVFTNHDNHLQNNQSCPFCSFVAHTTSTYTLTEHIKLHFNGTLVQPDPLVGMESVKELLIE